MTDRPIDHLYRLPLGEFTSARNALAKALGAAGTPIKALEKPTLAAWAVNQVFWHERGLWDALMDASTRVRQAHVQMISGRTADVATLEAAHARALKGAVAAARRQAEAAGESLTPATLAAVSETLQALPSADPAGQLTKPLKPLGLAALMAMGIEVQGSNGPGVQGSRSPGVQGSRSPGVQGSRSPGVRESNARRKELQRALKAAEAAEAKADAALAEAQKAVTTANRDIERLRDKLAFLEKQRGDAVELVRARTQARQDAANVRVQTAQDLRALLD